MPPVSLAQRNLQTRDAGRCSDVTSILGRSRAASHPRRDRAPRPAARRRRDGARRGLRPCRCLGGTRRGALPRGTGDAVRRDRPVDDDPRRGAADRLPVPGPGRRASRRPAQEDQQRPLGPAGRRRTHGLREGRGRPRRSLVRRAHRRTPPPAGGAPWSGRRPAGRRLRDRPGVQRGLPLRGRHVMGVGCGRPGDPQSCAGRLPPDQRGGRGPDRQGRLLQPGVSRWAGRHRGDRRGRATRVRRPRGHRRTAAPWVGSRRTGS